MAEMNGEKLMNEIDGFLNAAESDSSAEAAQPFEAFDAYSTDPLTFNDQSKLMLDKVDAVFNLAVKYNRHSSQYLKACGKLEQGIKFLASGCLTKIALEMHNYELPDLGQLTTDKLFRMTSYHFRKIDRALSESIQQNDGEVDDDLLDMQFRYYNLLNRLRVTEVRIHNYHSKYYFDDKKNYDPVVNGLAFSEKSWNSMANEHLEPASFQKARAFTALQIAGVNASGAGKKAENEEGRSKNEEVASDSIGQQLWNEEGRMKKEEAGSDSSDLQSKDSVMDTENAVQESDPLHSEHSTLHTAAPAYLETLLNALKRGQEAGDPESTILLTEEEMHQLLQDSEFCRFEPEMAENLRRIVNDSG